MTEIETSHDAEKVPLQPRQNGITKGFRGAVVGALLGYIFLVNSDEFKGQLAETEFLVSYLSQIAGAAFMGAIVGFSWPPRFSWLRQKAHPVIKPPASKLNFYGWAVVIALLITGEVVMKYPDGEGLFHPTHAMNIASAQKICLKNLVADTVDSQAAKIAYCSCWGEQMIKAYESNAQERPEILGQKASAACAPNATPLVPNP